MVVVTLAVTIPLAGRNLIAWLQYGSDHLLRTDLGLYYAFASIGLTHGWDRLYDLDAQRAVYASMPGLWWFPLPYTPPIAWLIAPLTALPLPTAYWIWCAGLAAAFGTAWWLATPRTPLLKAACLTGALSPYFTQLGLELGQLIIWQVMAVALAVWLLTRNRDLWAGITLVALDLHPQGFFLLPVALLLFGARKAFVAWAAASALLILVSALSLGVSGTEQYLQRLLLAQHSPLEYYVTFSIDLPVMIHNRWLRVATEGALIGLTLIVVRRQRRGRLEVAVATSLVGSILVTSFIHLDDLIVLILAGWLCLRAELPSAFGWTIVVGLVVGILLDYERVVHFGWLMILLELAWLGMLGALPWIEQVSAPPRRGGGQVRVRPPALEGMPSAERP